jgi:xylitol oxidase
LAIHFTWKPVCSAVREVLPMIEAQLAPFDPRPHWAKLFTMAPYASYERLADFQELAHRLDPQGKFRNDYLNCNVTF